MKKHQAFYGSKRNNQDGG